MPPAIYLDNNATTRPHTDVVRAVERALVEHWHNPSSVHRPGQSARQQVELARQSVARLIGAKPREIVFTSGGTESIDLAIRGVLAAARARGGGSASAAPARRPVVVSTAVEHAAVRDLLKALADSGEVEVRNAPLLEGGVADVQALEALLDEAGDRAVLVTIQWANNETGVIQPIEAIGALCRARKIPFHCDGVQWVGKAPSDVSAAPFDLLSLSAHKFHGPKGAGALWIRPGVRIAPVLHGTHEMDRRGGTENVPGIVGIGVAAERAMEWLTDAAGRNRLAALRDRFERGVLERVAGAVVNGVEGGDGEGAIGLSTQDPRLKTQDRSLRPQASGLRPSSPPHSTFDIPHSRLWNTTNIAFPRLEAEALLIALSERGVCASAGAACSSGSLDPSPVLLAMGIPPELAHGSLRFSLSRETTDEEIDQAVRIVEECAARVRGSMSAVG